MISGGDFVHCPACSTKDKPSFCQQIGLHRKDLLQCCVCYAIFKEKADGSLVPLSPILEKIRLGDDLISAVSPDTVAGESILRSVDMFESQQKSVTLAFVGKVRALMQQLEGRAHFIHGELAKRAVADNTYGDLLTTAKQIIDLVSAHPDGIRKDGAEL